MSAQLPIPISVRRQLYQIFDDVLNNLGIEVFLFGSRATNTHRPDSDIDLAVRGLSDRKELKYLLEERLNQCHLSINVEIIPEEEASSETLQRIKEEGILFWPYQ